MSNEELSKFILDFEIERAQLSNIYKKIKNLIWKIDKLKFWNNMI